MTIENPTQDSSRADLGRALAYYDDLAPRYDQATRRIDGMRAKAVAMLGLREGDVVLDAGCGTGYCFAAIEQAIGPGGHLVGMEPSPEMLSRAQRRVDDARWTNVTLLCASGETAQLSRAPTAILFSYTHDLLQSPAGLGNLFRQAAPGARVVAAGSQLFPRWFLPGNWYMRRSHRGYITNFAAFEAPWRILARYLDDFRVARQWPGERYLATGVLGARPRN